MFIRFKSFSIHFIFVFRHFDSSSIHFSSIFRHFDSFWFIWVRSSSERRRSSAKSGSARWLDPNSPPPLFFLLFFSLFCSSNMSIDWCDLTMDGLSEVEVRRTESREGSTCEIISSFEFRVSISSLTLSFIVSLILNPSIPQSSGTDYVMFQVAFSRTTKRTKNHDWP